MDKHIHCQALILGLYLLGMTYPQKLDFELTTFKTEMEKNK
jgi:hypothetical protein